MARMTAAERADLEGAAGVTAAESDEELGDLTGDGVVDQDDADAAAVTAAADELPPRRGPGHEDYAAEWGDFEIPASIAHYLKPDEARVIVFRLHIVRLLAPAAAVAGGLVLAVILNALAYSAGHANPTTVHLIWWAYLAAAGWGVYKYLEWRQTWFVVTGYRVMLIETTRLLGRRIRMVPIDKLRDLEYSQTSLGRIWKYATFTFASIGTGGADNALTGVAYLPWPEWLYQRISELIMPSTTGRVIRRGPK